MIKKTLKHILISCVLLFPGLFCFSVSAAKYPALEIELNDGLSLYVNHYDNTIQADLNFKIDDFETDIMLDVTDIVEMHGMRGFARLEVNINSKEFILIKEDNIPSGLRSMPFKKQQGVLDLRKYIFTKHSELVKELYEKYYIYKLKEKLGEQNKQLFNCLNFRASAVVPSLKFRQAANNITSSHHISENMIREFFSIRTTKKNAKEFNFAPKLKKILISDNSKTKVKFSEKDKEIKIEIPGYYTDISSLQTKSSIGFLGKMVDIEGNEYHGLILPHTKEGKTYVIFEYFPKKDKKIKVLRDFNKIIKAHLYSGNKISLDPVEITRGKIKSKNNTILLGYRFSESKFAAAVIQKDNVFIMQNPLLVVAPYYEDKQKVYEKKSREISESKVNNF